MVEYLTAPDGLRLAYHKTAGKGPTLVFLPGFMSDMTGSKVLALEQWAVQHGQAMLRFDYSGHGQSDGAFSDGTLSRWLSDVLLMIDSRTEGRLLLIGSSMGGWLALLAAMARPARVQGLILIAPAPDFTTWGLEDHFSARERQHMATQGYVDKPSQYGDVPYRITQQLIEDGRCHLLLNAAIPIDVPVRILQGQNDPDVPWPTALKLAEQIVSNDIRTILIKEGDHRLSRPADLALLCALAMELYQN